MVRYNTSEGDVSVFNDSEAEYTGVHSRLGPLCRYMEDASG